MGMKLFRRRHVKNKANRGRRTRWNKIFWWFACCRSHTSESAQNATSIDASQDASSPVVSSIGSDRSFSSGADFNSLTTSYESWSSGTVVAPQHVETSFDDVTPLTGSLGSDDKTDYDQYIKICEAVGFHQVTFIPPNDLEEVEDQWGTPVFLGGGVNGGVTLMRRKSTKTLVAVKSQYKSLEYAQASENFEREFKVLMSLQGLDRFPKLYGITPPQDGGPFPAIVEEFIGDSQSLRGTRLYDAIKAKSITKYQSILVALEIAEAMRDMHRHNWFHCDLKSDNILVQPAASNNVAEPTTQAAAINIKLIDFGFAADVNGDGLYLQMDDEQQRSALLVSRHIAPEVIRGQMAFYEASEVFSLGLIFRDLSTLGNTFLDILGKQCMKVNPDDRPDIDDVIDLIQFTIRKMQH